MKYELIASFATSILGVAMLSPNALKAQEIESSHDADGSAMMASAQQQAMELVPAQAELVRTLDAKKMQAGAEFRARLAGTVRLKDGTELPHGTTLIGVIANDSMRADGGSKLTLRFTQAELKNGKTMPITATIVGIARPEGDDGGMGEVGVLPWNPQMLQMDQQNAANGADLSSQIGGADSATLTAAKKDDVKLQEGTQLSLAIGTQGQSSAN
jgi:hypothetical protein